jgi:hypothetical protein
MTGPRLTETVRAASNADGMVSDMRQLVQVAERPVALDDAAQVERLVSYRVATILMVLLVGIIFATSALPDVGPSLAGAIQAHL